MRLIDLDAKEPYLLDGRFSVGNLGNAPTVEAYSFEQVQELVKLNQQFAQETENLKRPQGKWIEFADFVARNVVSEDFNEDVDFYAEVLCRKLVKLGLVKLDGDTYKYCGANMRGEE